MKVAVASSGLGHVARGIETWALDTAKALARVGGRGARGGGRDDEDGESLEVTLFAGAPIERGRRKRGEVRGTGGGGVEGVRCEGAFGIEDAVGAGGDRACARDAALTARGYRNDPLPSMVILSCFRRSGRTARFLARWSPGFTWRWGFKSAYGWEQASMWFRLWPWLVWGRYDILHVQGPYLADWCRRFRRLGLVRTKEILAHGTEEPVEFLARFEYVQHLAPWHLAECER